MEDHIWNGNTLILWQGQLFLPVCHHRHSKTAFQRPQVSALLVLLRQLPVHFCLDLGQLQLDPQGLCLFQLQRPLGMWIGQCWERALGRYLETKARESWTRVHPPLWPALTSASSSAACSSLFSPSSAFLAFSSSWMLFPLRLTWSVRSLISSAG